MMSLKEKTKAQSNEFVKLKWFCTSDASLLSEKQAILDIIKINYFLSNIMENKRTELIGILLTSIISI